jgi:hypothetical protein
MWRRVELGSHKFYTAAFFIVTAVKTSDLTQQNTLVRAAVRQVGLRT